MFHGIKEIKIFQETDKNAQKVKISLENACIVITFCLQSTDVKWSLLDLISKL